MHDTNKNVFALDALTEIFRVFLILFFVGLVFFLIIKTRNIIQKEKKKKEESRPPKEKKNITRIRGEPSQDLMIWLTQAIILFIPDLRPPCVGHFGRQHVPAAASFWFASFQLATGAGSWLPAGLTTRGCTAGPLTTPLSRQRRFHVLFSVHSFKLMVRQTLRVLLFHDADLHTEILDLKSKSWKWGKKVT